jgi:hypothetical protein
MNTDGHGSKYLWPQAREDGIVEQCRQISLRPSAKTQKRGVGPRGFTPGAASPRVLPRWVGDSRALSQNLSRITGNDTRRARPPDSSACQYSRFSYRRSPALKRVPTVGAEAGADDLSPPSRRHFAPGFLQFASGHGKGIKPTPLAFIPLPSIPLPSPSGVLDCGSAASAFSRGQLRFAIQSARALAHSTTLRAA